ncbi:MAG: hypothetical protein ACXQT5_06285 [Candidatus Syntropharchaeia archaeon]
MDDLNYLLLEAYKAIGTPLGLSKILKYCVKSLQGKWGIVLRKENNEYTIFDTINIFPERISFKDLDSLGEYLEKPVFIYRILDFAFALDVRMSSEAKEFLKEILTLFSLKRQNEEMNKKLDKISYYLMSSQNYARSIIEPLPREDMLNLAMEASAELSFSPKVCIYEHLQDGEYILKKAHYGRGHYPRTIKVPRKWVNPAIVSYPIFSAPDVKLPEEARMLLFLEKEGKNKDMIVLFRDKALDRYEEEMLTLLYILTSKSLTNIESKEELSYLTTELTKSGFFLNSLYEYVMNILSASSEELLLKNVSDMIKELLNVEWVAVYKRLTRDDFILAYTLFVGSKPEFPKTIHKNKYSISAKMLKVKDHKNILKYKILLEDKKFTSQEQHFTEIVTRTAEKALKLLTSQIELKEREEYQAELLERVSELYDVMNDMRGSVSIEELIDLSKNYLSTFLDYNGLTVIHNAPQGTLIYGDKIELELKMLPTIPKTIEYNDSYLTIIPMKRGEYVEGYVVGKKSKWVSERDFFIFRIFATFFFDRYLNLLSTINEGARINFEELIKLSFLTKVPSHGRHFYKILTPFDPDNLEGLGSVIVGKKEIYCFTPLSRGDLCELLTLQKDDVIEF